MIATATTIPQPRCNLMTITPVMASNWLEHANTNNRAVSESYVRLLARDMIEGRWKITHEGLAFDPHGMLLDGQHRLRAIITAGLPIQMHVWFNITPEALEVINGGRSRSLADRLRLGGRHGEVSSRHTSTLKWLLGGMSGPVTLTSAEASEAMSRHGGAVEFALRAVPRGKYIANGTTRGVIARAYYSVAHERLRQFGEMLITGVVPHPGAAGIVLLRQHLYTHRGTGSQLLRERYAKTERALLAFLENDPITRLMAARQELFALPEEVNG